MIQLLMPFNRNTNAAAATPALALPYTQSVILHLITAMIKKPFIRLNKTSTRVYVRILVMKVLQVCVMPALAKAISSPSWANNFTEWIFV